MPSMGSMALLGRFAVPMGTLPGVQLAMAPELVGVGHRRSSTDEMVLQSAMPVMAVPTLTPDWPISIEADGLGPLIRAVLPTQWVMGAMAMSLSTLNDAH